MAKVLLLDSPSWRLFSPTMHLHLGVLYLAGSLRAAGHQVKVLNAHDPSVSSWDGKNLHVSKDLEGCDILGLSATTANVNWGSDLAKEWKRQGRCAITVLGGPHVTHVIEGPHERFKKKKFFEGFDYLMVEECEESFVKLCSAYDKSGPGELLRLSSVPGLIWWNEFGMQKLGAPAKPDVTKLPGPAFDLWDAGFATGGLAGASEAASKAGALLTASLYTARGCFEQGTLIETAQGRKKIEDVEAGEGVVCIDPSSGKRFTSKVAARFEREAEDVFTLIVDGPILFNVTGEHPFWTQRGWVAVQELSLDDFVLLDVRQGVQAPSFNEEAEVLLERLLQKMEQESPRQGISQIEDASCKSQGKAGSGKYDQGGAVKKVGASANPLFRGAGEDVSFEDGRVESCEKARGCRKDLEVSSKILEKTISATEGEVGGRNDADALAEGWLAGDEEQRRNSPGIDTSEIVPSVQVLGRQGLLGGSLQVGKLQEPGLRGPGEEESDTPPRRVLSSSGASESRAGRLRPERIQGADSVVLGTGGEEKGSTSRQACFVWRRIKSKVFKGSGKVFNLTVCPGHVYLANSVLVHNCPYGCTFCADARTTLREETYEQIESQVLQLAELGVKAIRIQDDSYSIKKARAMRIADILHGHGMYWRGTTRVNLTDPLLFRHFASRNCTELGFGIEHGSARMLKAMNKGTTPGKNEEGVRQAQDAGIIARAFLMIGFPGETEESLDEMKEWIKRVKPSACTLSLFSPFPGSDVWNRPEVYGVTIPDDVFGRMWQLGGEDSPDCICVEIPTLSKERIFSARKEMISFLESEIGSLDRTLLGMKSRDEGNVGTFGPRVQDGGMTSEG